MVVVFRFEESEKQMARSSSYWAVSVKLTSLIEILKKSNSIVNHRESLKNHFNSTISIKVIYIYYDILNLLK